MEPYPVRHIENLGRLGHESSPAPRGGSEPLSYQRRGRLWGDHAHEALREVEHDPHAKLIVYEPRREAFAWLASLKRDHGLRSKLRYYLPSDRRSLALDFANDFPSDSASQTLAHAFFPQESGNRDPFWGDALRAIVASVASAILRKLGRCDLRLICEVLGDQELTRALLAQDPDVSAARELVVVTNEPDARTTQNHLWMAILARTAEMRVIAAHLDRCEQENGLISLRDFLDEPEGGALSSRRMRDIAPSRSR